MVTTSRVSSCRWSLTPKYLTSKYLSAKRPSRAFNGPPPLVQVNCPSPAVTGACTARLCIRPRKWDTRTTYVIHRHLPATNSIRMSAAGRQHCQTRSLGTMRRSIGSIARRSCHPPSLRGYRKVTSDVFAPVVASPACVNSEYPVAHGGEGHPASVPRWRLDDGIVDVRGDALQFVAY
jgi:hypothetical protein